MKISNQIYSKVESIQSVLEQHPVFSAISDRQSLQTFMHWHVFAVWDFMSLVKRLQRELTCTELPWLPPKFPAAARLINDIVLGEECDVYPQGGHMSHFELYLQAMHEIGAETKAIDSFIAALRAGTPVSTALAQLDIAEEIKDFVKATLDTAMHGSIHHVLGSFFFGRENVIPGMFQRLLDSWHVDEQDAPMFVYYLKRHIELDGDSHGPAAQRMIEEICGDDDAALQNLAEAARMAVASRQRLWDGLLARL